MMVLFPYLQIFADNNKRISRLAANLSVLRADLVAREDVVERAADQGDIVANGAIRPICELEYESKAGAITGTCSLVYTMLRRRAGASAPVMHALAGRDGYFRTFRV
jgi:hypothetical protein